MHTQSLKPFSMLCLVLQYYDVKVAIFIQGNHSVEFQAYTNQEIQKIIKHRLKSTGASIPDKTIEFSAMKVILRHTTGLLRIE